MNRQELKDHWIKNGKEVVDLGIGYDFEAINAEIEAGRYLDVITIAYHKSEINADYLYTDEPAYRPEDIKAPGPIITLSNGRRVANFSSPHPFTFTDGSVLPAVSNEQSYRLQMISKEDIFENGDIELSFILGDDVIEEMLYWLKLYKSQQVDVVFCPLPMIMEIKQSGICLPLSSTPFRAIRVEDRIKKLVSIDKQCI